MVKQSLARGKPQKLCVHQGGQSLDTERGTEVSQNCGAQSPAHPQISSVLK